MSRIAAGRRLVGCDEGQSVCHVIDGVGCIREASCAATVALEWRGGMADDASRIRPTRYGVYEIDIRWVSRLFCHSLIEGRARVHFVEDLV